MKTFKEFLSESVNISGDFNGNLYINSSPESQIQSVGEEFVADILWMGNIHRLHLKTESKNLTKQSLTEKLQKQYPGSIVHNIYPVEESIIDITNEKRYHPAKLEWI
jgi:hypothetical protein